MGKLLPAIATSLVIGFAAASWMALPDWADEPATSDDSTAAGMSFDASAPVEERMRALEQAVSDERFARQLLQEEVFYLTSELERISIDSDFVRA